MAKAVEHSDILKVYKANYDELTYQVVCLKLANKMLTEEIEQLRAALDSPDLDDLGTE